MAIIDKSEAMVRNGVVERHAELKGGYRELTLRSPEIAGRIRPGQFLHLRVPRLRDRILRRPFSVFNAENGRIVIIYKCVGVGTDVLACAAIGDEISLLGPLGNGFPAPDAANTPVLVGGGYGSGAVYMTAKLSPIRGVAFFGGRSADDILCVEHFDRLGWETHVATDDGSRGRTGLVTDALDDWLAGAESGAKLELFACGPHGMLKAVGERAMAIGCNGWLSLDRPMGCGVGACLACVQKIRTPGGEWVYERTCKDGPVFESRTICWEEVAE